jgi:hypothetical protein
MFRLQGGCGGDGRNAHSRRSRTAWRTGQNDPERTLKIGTVNGRKREKADFGRMRELHHASFCVALRLPLSGVSRRSLHRLQGSSSGLGAC